MSIVFKDLRRSSDRYRRYTPLANPTPSDSNPDGESMRSDGVSVIALAFLVATTVWLMLRQ